MVFLIGLAAVLFICFHAIDALYAKGHVSIRIFRITSDLIMQTYEYGITGGERERARWLSLNRTLDGVLTQARTLLGEPGEKALLAEVNRVHTEAGKRFVHLTEFDDEIRRHGGEMSSQPRNDMIKSIVLELHAMVPLADRLHDMIKAGIRRYTRYEACATLSLVLTVIMLLPLGLFLLINRITYRLEQLRKGMNAVATGDLKYRIDAGADDEVGIVVQGFNAMTVTLEEITVKREELVKEITERKQAEEKLSFLAAIVESSDDAIIGKSPEGIVLSWNRGAERLYGYREEEIKGRSISILIPRDLPGELSYFLNLVKGGKPIEHYETSRLRKDGSRIEVSLTVSPILDSGGTVIGASTIARGITERKQMEEKLRLAGEYNRSLIEASLDPLVTIDTDGRIADVNAATESVTGYPREELVGRDFSDFFTEPDKAKEGYQRVFREGMVHDYELEIRHRDGHVTPVLYNASVYSHEAGNIRGVFAAARVITERKRAEKDLAERVMLAELYADIGYSLTKQDDLRSMLTACAETLVWHLDVAFARIWTLNIAENVLELQASAGMYTRIDGAHSRVPVGKFKIGMIAEERKPHVTNAVIGDPRVHDQEWAEREGMVAFAGHPLISKDKLVGVMAMFSRKPFSDVTLAAMLSVSNDIASGVEHKRAEKEQARLLEQLRQSQKMEAIGLLAGGVAHDFNNMLTAIIGYGSVLQMKMADDDPLGPSVDKLLAVVDRAAGLTQSLLAFSRKQEINLQPVNLNDIIGKVEKFLARIIGEDIEFHTTFRGAPLIVTADSGQIEQVLMNLATNARDAMPHGGLLSIVTEATEMSDDYLKAHGYGEPGMYALVSVTDTGTGMDATTTKRIFEPFFTTKEPEKGTGLGLAVVYGIVKQHGGYINVYSEPGQGTTFRIYLPLLKGGEGGGTEPAPLPKPTGGMETILLAEDEDELRTLLKAVLTEYGYTVIEAEDGEDAVSRFIENRERIQLLLFDLIMPKKSGKDACDEIRKMGSDVRAIFVSGYPRDVLQGKGFLEEENDLIMKPVSPQNLLRKIREVLDR
jgi:PAS domain S-box-containing protein